MTNKDIEKYNNRCSKLLGLTPLKRPYIGAFTTNGGTNIPNSFLNLINSEMDGESWYVYPKFDSDWNWIMEVVGSIKQLISEWEHIYTMSPQEQKIDYQLFKENELANSIQHLTIYAQKETVVEAINQFLIWYNENSKNTMV